MKRLALSLVSLGSLALACDRGTAAEPKPAPAKAASKEPAPTVMDDQSFRMPGAKRVVAIGDVHGDAAATRKVLRMVGAIDEKDEWVGRDLVVVQTGDQLDRGDDEPEILDLFEALEKKAKAAGGRFYTLNGNHEVMNVAGDFRYVTEDGFTDYAKTEPATGTIARRVLTMDEKTRGRAAAFLPGGPQAKRLATRPIAIVVGDTAFAHGGILPGHLRYGLARINDEARRWMSGETSKEPEALSGPTSPIWTRDYSDGEPSARSCAALERALGMLRAKRMVVGHTVQKDGITSGCGDKIWRIDVGLAKHYGGTTQALEITPAGVRALTEDGAKPSASAFAATPSVSARPAPVLPTKRAPSKTEARAAP